jgi:hypothetical protein
LDSSDEKWKWNIYGGAIEKVESYNFNSGHQLVIRLITPLRMSYEGSYAKAFPFDKMVPSMLDPEMIEDPAKIVNEAMRDKIQANLIINNRSSGDAPMIARKIADRLNSEKQQRLF